MKIALIKPPPTYADWNRRPILGICYISAFLKSQGIDCKIFDAYFNHWSKEELIDRIVEYKPTLIGECKSLDRFEIEGDRITKKLSGRTTQGNIKLNRCDYMGTGISRITANGQEQTF